MHDTPRDTSDRPGDLRLGLMLDHLPEFLGTLAHELRGPLSPICNSLHILRMSDDLSPAIEHVRGVLERQVAHLVRLVDEVLEVSRLARCQVELQPGRVELATVTGKAVEAVRPLIDQHRHQLSILVPSTPITIEADSPRLAQVIINLLTNAAKFTDDGGQIWLSARSEGGQAVVSVRDNGLGIEHDKLPRIFDWFAPYDDPTARRGGGLGIGLALAKTLMEMHGGQIEAASDGPRQGSEFTIRIPLAPALEQSVPAASHAVSASSAATASPATPRFAMHRILVVDDTAAAAFMLGKLMEKLGQQVRTATSAAAALESLRAEPADLVLSDIGMPQMDGYELARRIRQLAGSEHVTLVALTGYGDESDRQRSREAGFDHHLVKPVSLDALERLLRSLPPPQVAPRVLESKS